MELAKGISAQMTAGHGDMDEIVGRVLARTGGSHQRIQAGHAPPESSVMAERLREAWGWGMRTDG